MFFLRETFADEANSSQLFRADEIKTSNPSQSHVLLENIDEAQLRHSEKALYQYLIALNAFMNGDVQKANILLNQLIGNTKDTIVKLRTLGTLLSVYAASNDCLSALQTVNIMNDHLDTDPSLKNNEINDNKKIF